MRIMVVLMSILVVLVFTAANAAKSLPFEPCKRSDPGINKCILESLNAAREKISKGDPSIGLASLSPLVGHLMQDVPDQPDDFTVTENSYKSYGLGDYNITSVTFNAANSYLEMEIDYPGFRIEGHMTIIGQIMNIKVDGDGNYLMILGPSNGKHIIQLAEVERAGEIYWNITKYHWKGHTSSCHVDAEELFAGNKFIKKYGNKMINANWRFLWMMYKKFIGSIVGEALQKYANDFLEKVPLKTFLTD